MRSQNVNAPDSSGHGDVHPVKVWDLPIRLFHWLLVALVITSFVTGNMGGNAMQNHVRSGYAILVLLLFRILWGVAGSHTTRFRSFLHSPAAAWRYARQLLKKDYPRHLGHNPLGGWSIVAMLLALMLQAATGLFADDGILTRGPLALRVSGETSSLLTLVHMLNRYLIVALVALHVLAVLFYLVVKRDNLITPMITGVKQWRGRPDPPVHLAPTWLAALIAALAALAVYLLVR
jgi:cytochrome b